ncbi:cytochrome b-c1 complex subunit 7-2, mitochondrial-like [Benincasa hispida]|uniref:cytochrome b-c1 complex subunit 7-2, mitochondrial-like n=1 Tax=Benincasa hispida TaxID=102211 RepID=UPI001900043C|nr:cytochrome b-c1 complex subunit 7-2, mitochondrial-like [Benincasa hispida]
MASFLQSFINPKKNWFSCQHMKALTQRLRNYGLQYDDMYDPYYDIAVKEALNRLPREVVDVCNHRLKQAMDLSMKHQYLPDDLQAMQTLFRSYLQDMLAFFNTKDAYMQGEIDVIQTQWYVGIELLKLDIGKIPLTRCVVQQVLIVVASGHSSEIRSCFAAAKIHQDLLR